MNVPISLDDFEKLIKIERNNNIVTPYDLAYKSFIDLSYQNKTRDFFVNSSSEFILKMREQCWREFLSYEREFTVRLLKKLIDDKRISNMTAREALDDYLETYPDHFYALALSNTQSRRSRAGKEFEAILEILLIGADLRVDSQGAIGKDYFQKNGLGKLVDFVSPGVVEYMHNKRNTTLISAKTTLRERWQEVPEEVTRTGAREMYLATLDDIITKETIKVLYEANVIFATTKSNKENLYNKDQRIVSFEELITIIAEAAAKWNDYAYTKNDLEQMKAYLISQVEKHEKHEWVKKYYLERLSSLSELNHV